MAKHKRNLRATPIENNVPSNDLVAALIKKYKGKVLTYSRLPTSAQLAVLQDMAVDGNRWCPFPDEENDSLESQLPYYVKKYGKAKFGLVVIPTDELAQVVIESAKKGDGFKFKTFKGYHKWYLRTESVSDYGDSVWPVFLGDSPNEAISDGVQRFHSYIRKGLTTIPCLYYVEDSWKRPIPKHCWKGMCPTTLVDGHCECPCQECEEAGIYHG